MKKLKVLIGAGIGLLGMVAVAQAAPIITFDYSLVNTNQYTTPFSGTTVETFDSALLWSWSGDYDVTNGSASGYAAAPAGDLGVQDTTDFLVVPGGNLSSGTATATLGASYNYFGLWWGSMDDYNSLRFYDGNTLVETIFGIDVSNDPNGNWTNSGTNKYVNFLNLPDFNKFSLTSDKIAFEVDNIAVGNVSVPEPTTLLLLGAGLLGLAGARRRKVKK